MYLYLVGCDKSSFVFQNISLIDGYLPCVADADCPEAVNTAKALSADLEPAIWFKVTILDHVAVDCPRKTVKWSVRSPQKDTFTDSLNCGGDVRVTRSLYMENELDDLESSIDTLFEAGEQLIGSLVSNSGDSHRLLLDFLTNYVLPVISIFREDEDVLIAALQKQLEFIKNLDNEIDVQTERAKRLKHTLRDFRLSVVQDFIATRGKLRKSRPELYAIVSDHLQKDIVDAELRLRASGENFLDTFAGWPNLAATESEQRLERVCAEVEQLKVAFTMLTEPAPKRSLRLGRNVLDSPEFLRDRKPVHDLYMASSSILETLRAETAELLERKVVAMSVKEAMCAVCRDLSCSTQTAGYETQSGTGLLATSIRTSRVKSSLALIPMEEKLRAALSDPSHKAHAVHERFCEAIWTTCADARASAAADALATGSPLVLEKAHPTARESEDVWTAQHEPALAVESRSGSASEDSESWDGREDDEEDCDSFIDFDRPSLVDIITELRTSVVRHCAAVADLVQLNDGADAKARDGPTVKHRKQLCYEYYLYERIGAQLLALFGAMHGEEAVQFADELRQLTADDLQLTEPWQLCVLADVCPSRSSDSGGGGGGGACRLRLHAQQQQPAAQAASGLNGATSAEGDNQEINDSGRGDGSGGPSGDWLQPPPLRSGEAPAVVRADAARDLTAGSCGRGADAEEQAVDPCPPQADGAWRQAGEDNAAANVRRSDFDITPATARADAAASTERARSAENVAHESGGSRGCGDISVTAEESSGCVSSPSSSTLPFAGAVFLRPAATATFRRGRVTASVGNEASDADRLTADGDAPPAIQCSIEVGGVARDGVFDAEPAVRNEWRSVVVAPCVECLGKLDKQPSPLGKLQLLTRCLRILAAGEGKLRRIYGQRFDQQVSPSSATDIAEKPRQRPPSACSDDLIAATTLLLLFLDTSLVRSLYVQLKFIEAFMSEGLQSGVHAFSLTTYAGAVWHARSLAQRGSSHPPPVRAHSVTVYRVSGGGAAIAEQPPAGRD